MDHPARGVPPFMETPNHIDTGTGPKVGTALMMVSSTFSMREMVFGRGKLAISLDEPAFLALLKGQCVSPKQIETANHSADILSYVSLHFLKGYQTCSRQISELFLFNGGLQKMHQVNKSKGLLDFARSHPAGHEPLPFARWNSPATLNRHRTPWIQLISNKKSI